VFFGVMQNATAEVPETIPAISAESLIVKYPVQI